MSFKALVAAAAVTVGIGSAAAAATSNCEYSGWYDPPIYGEKSAYTFDVRVVSGFAGDDSNVISSYGGFSADTPVRMSVNMTVLPADYCADVTLSSPGRSWVVDNSSYGNWVFAAGATSDGGKFVFVWDAPGDSSQGLTKYIDLEYSTEADYVWLLLAIENIATVEIAPVPVPLSAAFLPVGLGAFAMLRKRRRRVS